MIDILKQENNVITYRCTNCGAKGMCTFKPPNKDAVIVIELKCPSCSKTESITLLQYSNSKSKDFFKNIESIDLSWAPFINEELLEEDSN